MTKTDKGKVVYVLIDNDEPIRAYHRQHAAHQAAEALEDWKRRNWERLRDHQRHCVEVVPVKLAG